MKSCVVAAALVALVWQAALSRFAVGYWIEQLGASYGRSPTWIRPLIRPPDPKVALRQIGEAAVPRCIDGLSSPDWRRRVGAAEALGLYGAAATPAIPALIEAIRGPFDDASPMTDPQSLIRDVAVRTLLQLESGHATARELLTAALSEALPAETEPLVVADPSNRARWNDRARRIWAAYALAQLDPGNAASLDVLSTDLLYEDTAFRAMRREKYKGPRAEDIGAFANPEGPGYYYNREMDVRGAALAALVGLSHKAAWRTPVDPSTKLRLLNGLVEHATQPMSPSVAATNHRIDALTVIAKMAASARAVAPALAPLLTRPEEALVRPVRATLEEICPEWDGKLCPPE